MLSSTSVRKVNLYDQVCLKIQAVYYIQITGHEQPVIWVGRLSHNVGHSSDSVNILVILPYAMQEVGKTIRPLHNIFLKLTESDSF